MTPLTEHRAQAYRDAQHAMALLKAAIHRILFDAGAEGMKNVEIGKTLGIYAGHVRHEGHIPRTLLAIMEGEGITEQDPESKAWRLKTLGSRGIRSQR